MAGSHEQPAAPVEVPPCGCAEPGAADPAHCYCGVDDLLRVIRRRYSLAVLNVIRTAGVARFHDLETSLPGASTSTLAETLRALVAVRLLERAAPLERVPRTTYRLTASGAKLLSRLRRLLEEVQSE